MTELQAISVSKWLMRNMGEEYDIDVIHNVVNDGYRVVVSHVHSEWPQIVIYNAINLDEDEEIW